MDIFRRIELALPQLILSLRLRYSHHAIQRPGYRPQRLQNLLVKTDDGHIDKLIKRRLDREQPENEAGRFAAGIEEAVDYRLPVVGVELGSEWLMRANHLKRVEEVVEDVFILQLTLSDFKLIFSIFHFILQVRVKEFLQAPDDFTH